MLTEGSEEQIKVMNESQSRFYLIIGIIFTVNFACCVAYSAVAIIFPSRVLDKGLNSFWAGLIIAAYAISQMVSGPGITYLLNSKGKKSTLMFGCALLGFSLPIFGLAVDFEKYIFLLVCIVCRLFIGFGSGCINSASNSIIAFNYPDKMSQLIGINQVVCSIGMIIG